MVQVKTQSLSLTVLLCFYVVLVFSVNPFIANFPGMSFEVTDQNNEGVFSSLSRNFDQTIEEINNADEKSTASSSTTSTDSSNDADEKSTASNVPIVAIESTNLISNNSTTNDDLKKN